MNRIVFRDVNEDDWDWFEANGADNYVVRRVDGNRLPFAEFMLGYANDSESQRPWVMCMSERIDG